MRTLLPTIVCGYVVCLAAGCANLVESRVVQAFAESFKNHDANRLKASASNDFEEKAVNGEDTFRALKMIELPVGMPHVVKVKDIKDEDGKVVVEKRVLATVGKEKRKIWFRLKPDGKTGRWVVDDLFLNKDDYNDETKSIATRLAVLLSLQESIDAWKSGARDQILAAATPEFRESLSQLTPEQLSQFARKCTAEMAADLRILPDERIDKETADLIVSKPDGDLLLRFRRDAQHWKLDDLALKSRRGGEDIASARHVTAAMATALQFEAAYLASDKRTLQQVSSKAFFEGSLAAADLGLVRLPEHGSGLDGFDIKLEESMATYIVPAGDEILKISLMQQPIEQWHGAPRFLVDEVTIYDLNSRQDKRLSSLFTAHATMEKFGAALAARDIAMLRSNATHDFNQRVWNNAIEAHFDGLPMAQLAAVKPRLVQTRFLGSMTEILVEHGDAPLTYVLREEGGRMLVDDVLSPARRWPESMKATAEVLVPVLNFSDGLVLWTEEHSNSELEKVRESASEEFVNVAWAHFDEQTAFDSNPKSFFKAPLSEVSLSEERANVVLGSDRQGATFSLVKENGHFKVDDVTLVAGSRSDQQFPLKRTIRRQLAQGVLR